MWCFWLADAEKVVLSCRYCVTLRVSTQQRHICCPWLPDAKKGDFHRLFGATRQRGYNAATCDVFGSLMPKKLFFSFFLQILRNVAGFNTTAPYLLLLVGLWLLWVLSAACFCFAAAGKTSVPTFINGAGGQRVLAFVPPPLRFFTVNRLIQLTFSYVSLFLSTSSLDFVSQSLLYLEIEGQNVDLFCESWSPCFCPSSLDL